MASLAQPLQGGPPTPGAGTAPRRFVRTLADVDHPSPLRWRRWPDRTGTYYRRMGLVESFFCTMGTLHHGRTDIFHGTPISFPAAAKEGLLARLPLAYAILCRRHPLLASYVQDLTPDLERFDTQKAQLLRQAGGSSGGGGPSALSEPHFVYHAPASAAELLESASQRVIFLPDGWQHEVAAPDGKTSEQSDLSAEWLRRYVWNGPRRFLVQDSPYGMARLLVMPGPVSAEAGSDRASVRLVLCVAHCIGDGLSVSALAAELLALLTSDHLPDLLEGQSIETPADVTVNGLHSRKYTPDVAEKLAPLLSVREGSKASAAAVDDFAPHAAEPLLPPPIEASFPSLLPVTTPSAAHKRWFWATRRVLAQLRASRTGVQHLTDFAAGYEEGLTRSANGDDAGNSWGALTQWSAVRLDEGRTSALVALAKRKGLRIGALLYAVSACALNQLAKEKRGTAGVAQEGYTDTTMGFPFSIRQYLRPRPTRFDGDEAAAGPQRKSEVKPSGLAVQLSFGGVTFPPPSVFALSADIGATDNPLVALSPLDRLKLWQMGRSAQRQLDALFRSPTTMMADGFMFALDRENKWRVDGVRDIFAKPDKEAETNGADDGEEEAKDEHRPGALKKNMQGPGSSINFSMLGSVDALFRDVDLSLPHAAGQVTLERDMLIGVRCREGEAFGTAFTFAGCLTLEVGHDVRTWQTSRVERYLALIRAILLGLVAAS